MNLYWSIVATSAIALSVQCGSAQEPVREDASRLFEASKSELQGLLRWKAPKLLLVNSDAVCRDGKLDPESPDWQILHDRLQRDVESSGPFRLLHIRLFYAKGSAKGAEFERAFREHAKRLLADVDIFLAYVDGVHFNSPTTWDEYVARLEARTDPKE